jgi:hypothetical protein
MSRILSSALALVFAAVMSASAFAADVKTVTGEVVDLECSLSKGPAGQGDAHAACAMACARDGKPMAILADDAVYLIEGDYTANKNAKLLDFVARRVEAKGTIGERDGKKTINVAAMMVLKKTAPRR